MGQHQLVILHNRSGEIDNMKHIKLTEDQVDALKTTGLTAIYSNEEKVLIEMTIQHIHPTRHSEQTPRTVSIELGTDALYELYEHGAIYVDDNSGVMVELKIPDINTRHLDQMGLIDDEGLMKIIADSAQELDERGYTVSMVRHVPHVSDEPQSNVYIVTASRSVTGGSGT